MTKRLLPAGETIRDTYTIVRHLGSGAFGDVYLARHRYMGLQAVKVFPLEGSSEVLEEAYLLTKLSHPNIVRMFEANEFALSGRRFGYFSMEYIEGGTLSEFMGIPEISLESKLLLAKDMLAGLGVAHRQIPPAIHRDISPSNVLVDKSHTVPSAKISDFGLAKHVDADSLLASAAGKFVYMAPESFLGRHSTASDVCSVGIGIFELLTGHHPFQFELSADATPKEIAQLVCRSRAQCIPDATSLNREVPTGWSCALTAALVHESDDRPQTAGDLLKLVTDEPSRPVSNSFQSSTEEIVKEAVRLSSQASTLDTAISLLELAGRLDPSVERRYADRKTMWKSGIVL